MLNCGGQPVRKSKQSGGPVLKSGRPPRALLSVRSALVLTVAVLAALGGAGLFYAAHRPVALTVLGAVGIFAAALKLLDSLIELSPSNLRSVLGRRGVFTPVGH